MGPYNHAIPVVPSNTVDIVGPNEALTDAIWVGGPGIVVAVLDNDHAVNFTCVAGQLLPLRVKRVNATGTTATLMQALFRV
jgi:hypothetical protein